MSLSRWQRRFYKILWIWKYHGTYPLFEWYGRLGRKLLKPVKTKAGFLMKINPADTVVSSRIWRTKSWGEAESQIILSKVKSGHTVIDVGANIGYFSLLFSQLVGKSGKVIAFEPDRDNFFLLAANTQLNLFSQLQPERVAVGAHSGVVPLFFEPENKGDHRVFQANGHVQTQMIPMISLDEYTRRHSLIPDFIKMDIQGFEIQALKGMKRILELPRVELLIEFWPKGLREAGEKPLDLFHLLTAAGFQLFELSTIQIPLSRQTFRLMEKRLQQNDTTIFATKFK